MRINRPAVMAFGGKVKSTDRTGRDRVFMNRCMLVKKGSGEYKCKSSNQTYVQYTHISVIKIYKYMLHLVYIYILLNPF